MDSNSQFEELYNQYHNVMVNFAMNMVNDEDAAKDIVQEVFIKLWTRRHDLEFGQFIKSYLYRATTNTALNYLETNKRKQQIFKALLDKIPKSSDSHSALEEKELKLKIREAIDKLPPKCKVIFILSRQEGKKYKEIAEELNVSFKTVENQMGIALKKLRYELRDYLRGDMAVLIPLFINSITLGVN